MRPLSASDLLTFWERGQTQRPVQRALALLIAACPDASPDELARLQIGRRDALLLTLREWTFGPRLECLAVCPACGERLELTFNVADIRVTHEDSTRAEDGELLLRVADHEVHFRLPDSRDLERLTAGASARQELLKQCLIRVRHQGNEIATDQAPSDLLEAVADKIAQADPQADVQLALSCARCGHRWQAPFDIVSFFWAEIHSWACRTLREIHSLASAYGWCEEDILNLSPWRRQVYLEMVGG